MINPESEQNEGIVEFINKRLRNQRKRLTKIETYEQLDKSTLNADQIQTLARKPEVLSTIKELEELLTKATACDQLHLMEIDRVRQEGEQNCVLQVSNAVNRTLQMQQQAIQHIHRLNYAMSLPLTALVGKHSVTQIEFNALLNLKNKFNPSNYQNATDYSLEMEKYHALLFNQVSEYVAGTELTFQALNALIVRLLLPPPPPPKFGMFDRELSDMTEVNEPPKPERVEEDNIKKNPKKKKFYKKNHQKKPVESQ